MPLQSPLVSVVMTTYKEKPERLCRTVDSVLGQTLSNLEFIIVFEKTDDNFAFLRQRYSDPRLIVTQNEGRPDRTQCNNMGLSLARGRYIARIDGDDYAYPDRLEKQVAFLQSHPDVALVGAAGRLVDEKGIPVGVRRFPADHDDIVRDFALTNPILHPAVMWDRDRTGWDVRYNVRGFWCDDLELWLRMLGEGRRFANMPEILVDYSQPAGYRRPRKHWRGNLKARLQNWNVIARHPRMILGLGLIAVMSVLPQTLIDILTQRSHFSDWVRSIKSSENGP